TVTELPGGYGSRYAPNNQPRGWATTAGPTHPLSLSGTAMAISYENEVVDCAQKSRFAPVPFFGVPQPGTRPRRVAPPISRAGGGVAPSIGAGGRAAWRRHMAKAPHVLGMVLAGGEGKRLHPLTRDRCKPAVPFGANYRIIDFALSNLVNGRFLRIAVLTQYKSHSLDRHIAQTWRMSHFFNNYVMTVPAQMRLGRRWFEGSADAILQNLNLIRDEEPDYICVFGADHIYRMDPHQMLEAHIESGAGVTVAGLRVPRAEASRFCVLVTGPDGRIASFREKPNDAPGLPDDPEHVFASMGNYVFSTRVLVDAVRADAENKESAHDMGGNIITMLVNAGMASVYDFAQNRVPGATER